MTTSETTATKPARKPAARKAAAPKAPAVKAAAPKVAAPVETPAPAAAASALPEITKMTEMFQNVPAQMPEAVRDFAEKGVAQARETYAKVKAAAEETTDLVEDAVEATRQGGLDIGQTVLDAAKANTDAAFKFAKDMMAVKSVSEAVELHAAFARERFDAFSAQAKDMQALVTKVTEEASAPVKAAVEKSLSELKAS